MRGLPPPPQEVWRVRQTFQVASSSLTCGFWIFNSGSAAPTPADFELFAAGWIFNVVPVLNAMTASDVSCSAFRIASYGAAPGQWEQRPPDNHGTLPGHTAPLNACACLTWTNNDRRGSHARTLLPLALGLVSADARTLTTTGVAVLRVGGTNLLSAINAIHSIDLSPCSPVVLHRQRNGAPLAASVVSLLLGVNPDLAVATCDRRIESRR